MTSDSATPLVKPGPSTAGYWVGIAVIVVGIVSAVAWFVFGLTSVRNTVDDFERVTADEGGTVTLDDGDYVVYVENGSLVAESFFSIEFVDPTGDDVPLRSYASDLTYDFGGRSGRAVSTFRADVTGDYTIGPVDPPSTTTIAVGESIAGSLVRTILVPFVIGGLAVLIGAIVLIVTLVRRSGAKKRASATVQARPVPGFPTAGPMPPPPGRPPPPPPPPPGSSGSAPSSESAS